jgi:hypothetical protein
MALVVVASAGCAPRANQPVANTNTAPLPTASATRPERPDVRDLLAKAVATAPKPFAGEGWQPLFDGKTLRGWRVTDFIGGGEVELRDGLIIFNQGDPFCGIGYTNETPKMNYELALDAMRVMGSDFFCGLTVPVGDSHCSLICGGWGGGLVGISSLDGMDASENETTKFMDFEKGRWYRIRLRVTTNRLEAWIDDEKLVDVDTTDRKISVRPGEIELSRPFGIASWQTMAALREIKVRKVDGPADPLKKRDF